MANLADQAIAQAKAYAESAAQEDNAVQAGMDSDINSTFSAMSSGLGAVVALAYGDAKLGKDVAKACMKVLGSSVKAMNWLSGKLGAKTCDNNKGRDRIEAALTTLLTYGALPTRAIRQDLEVADMTTCMVATELEALVQEFAQLPEDQKQLAFALASVVTSRASDPTFMSLVQAGAPPIGDWLFPWMSLYQTDDPSRKIPPPVTPLYIATAFAGSMGVDAVNKVTADVMAASDAYLSQPDLYKAWVEHYHWEPGFLQAGKPVDRYDPKIQWSVTNARAQWWVAMIAAAQASTNKYAQAASDSKKISKIRASKLIQPNLTAIRLANTRGQNFSDAAKASAAAAESSSNVGIFAALGAAAVGAWFFLRRK